jgi:hypothetical protein
MSSEFIKKIPLLHISVEAYLDYNFKSKTLFLAVFPRQRNFGS